MRNRFWRIAIALFFLACFLSISRILDMVGKGFRIPAIVLSLLGISLLASRRAFVFLRSTAGKIMPIFVAWVLLAWLMAGHTPGGLSYIRNLLAGIVLFVAAAGLLTTTADFSKLFTTLACAGVVAASMGIVWGVYRSGRFALRDGAYGDPNYYAMWLLALMPLIWTVVARKPIWARLGGLLVTTLPLFLLIKTGSRAGAISLGAMLIVLFFLSSLKMRVLVGGVAAVAIVVLLAFVPNALKSRLGPSNGPSAEEDSSAARRTLFVTALVMTLNNPLFGLGPGNFARAVVDEGRLRGEEYAPLATHNAYTQISSETGVPGAVLFLLLVAFSVVNVFTLVRQTSPKGATPDGDLHELARGLLLSLTGVCAFMFFLSEGYNSVVLLWLGLASGLRLLLPPPERELEEYEEVTEVENPEA
jgi:O-antigen ligase